ncbi:SLAF7 protein, partial [Acrocephalus arundinaceus]|nr:SLAF7 protein [Acrocephalus arundinaceus]
HPVFSPHFLSPASAGDTTEVIGAVGGAVTFRGHNTATEGNQALWSFGNEPIVTVEFGDPLQPVFSKDKFKTRFAVSEEGRALTISQLRMEDAGTYSVTINGEISTFTLLVYRELAEPSVTCEAQNCSGRNCLLALCCSVPSTGFGNVSYTWRVRDWLWKRQSMLLLVRKSSLDDLEPVTCTARNAVSSRNVTVTTPGVLCPG